MAQAKTNIKSKSSLASSQLWARMRGHYYTYMPNKRHHRIFVWVVFFGVSACIAAQMLYPINRALPLARIGDQFVGWQTDVDLSGRLTKSFADAELKLSVQDVSSIKTDIGAVGGEPQIDAMTDSLTDYPFWQRFIPLSILFHSPRLTTLDVNFAKSPIEDFSQKASQTLSQPPKNARLAIKDGQLVATSDTAGATVKSEDVIKAIRSAEIGLGQTTLVAVPATYQSATITAASLASVRADAESALGRPVTIIVNGQEFTPPQHQVATWLVIGEDNNHQPSLTFDKQRATKFLDEINKKVGTPAGQTNITLVDGRETARQTGAQGSKIDQKPLLEALDRWIVDGQGSADLYGSLVDVAPSVIYNHKYTASEAGLRAYVKDAARDQNANIVVQQLNGDRWTANAGGSISIPSASTYKLFVALVLFDKMDKNQVQWNDPILDTDVSTCFDRMTIASTNPCPREWLRQWGRGWTDQYIWNRGFSHGTSFTHPVAVHSTANDLTKFMVGFENCSLICGSHRDRLLHSLGTHPYRYGIPTGSAGKVWDKVGFLWDYVHDTAIVYHPKGHYVMTIMTKGRSYATIATITREIEKIMYP